MIKWLKFGASCNNNGANLVALVEYVPASPIPPPTNIRSIYATNMEAKCLEALGVPIYGNRTNLRIRHQNQIKEICNLQVITYVLYIKRQESNYTGDLHRRYFFQ